MKSVTTEAILVLRIKRGFAVLGSDPDIAESQSSTRKHC